ncbi:MAG: hypothetical protein ACI8PZ_000368 [Myxococcota bacterium]|jgi:hypothetical protein
MSRTTLVALLLAPATALAGGPMLTIDGACPGTIDVAAMGLTPGATIGVLSGRGPGGDIVPAGPCAGAPTNLAGLGLVTTVRADGAGMVNVSPSVGGPLCGTHVQFIDTATCAVSNVEVIGAGGGGFYDAFDAFDAGIWESQPLGFDYVDGSLLVTDGDAVMRTADMYDVMNIAGALNKDDACSDHFVVLSDSPSFSWSWGSVPGAVKFVWNCNTKYIYGQVGSDSVACDTLGDYGINIDISGDSAVFSDSTCGDISIVDPLLSSGPLWVYVGADCDGCTAEWYELSVN